MSILAESVWIKAESGDDWIEGEPGAIRVRREDEDEVSLGVKIRGDSETIVSLYLPVREARRLALSLAAASHDE